MDIAVYLVHSLGSQSSEAVDRAAAENVARAAGRAGRRQIVFLGGLGDDSPELSPHLRSRHETAKALASGPVPVTTLRAAMVVGAGSAAFETIRALVDRLPVMICPGGSGYRRSRSRFATSPATWLACAGTKWPPAGPSTSVARA